MLQKKGKEKSWTRIVGVKEKERERERKKEASQRG